MNVAAGDAPDRGVIETQTQNAARLTASSPVQVTLLLLYCLPILLLTAAAFSSTGFSRESTFLNVSLNVVTQYVESLREAFATFVIPFLTALSAGRWSRATKGGLRPTYIFFILVAILVMSIVLQAYMEARMDDFLAILRDNVTEATKTFQQSADIIRNYCKEVLTYMSLLLGISLWRRTGES